MQRRIRNTKCARKIRISINLKTKTMNDPTITISKKKFDELISFEQIAIELTLYLYDDEQ